MNVYIFVDPAKSKKDNSDYTAIAVIGLGPDKNKYLIDLFRDRMTLNERTKLIFSLHSKYDPIMVYYEEYGLQTDIEHIEYVMDERNYRFVVEKIGGGMAKFDRIMRLQPDLENGNWYIPQNLPKVSAGGDRYDAIEDFINQEYNEWPVPTHDDAMDCISRIYDIPQLFPDKNTITSQWEFVEDDIFLEDEWSGKQFTGRWR